jgi:hypothetical protein
VHEEMIAHQQSQVSSRPTGDDLRTIVIRFENCEVMENMELVLEAIRAVLRENVS